MSTLPNHPYDFPCTVAHISRRTFFIANKKRNKHRFALLRGQLIREFTRKFFSIKNTWRRFQKNDFQQKYAFVLPAFEMLHLIAPVQYAATKCGSYIANSNRQPDVEVLAVALDDIPHTAEEFDKKRGGRDFYICKFLIVTVGPAGFGKVPYTHKKKGKKGDEEICQGLYENVVDGVKLYAYEKGDTNKALTTASSCCAPVCVLHSSCAKKCSKRARS
jgi:hypothetical protein